MFASQSNQLHNSKWFSCIPAIFLSFIIFISFDYIVKLWRGSLHYTVPDHAIKLKFVAENHSWNVFCGNVRYTGNQSPVYVTSFMQETLV